MDLQRPSVLDLFEWNPSYSVGSITIDQQHKRLLALCKKLTNLPIDNSTEGKAVFNSVLKDIAFYASKHFESEEDTLRAIGYPKLGEQRSEHNEFNEQLDNFISTAANETLDRDLLKNYLEKWWINHILHSDMQYSSHLKP